LLPVSSADEYNDEDEVQGILKGFIGINGQLSGALTQIMPQKYYYFLSTRELDAVFHMNVFSEIVEITDEHNKSYDLRVIGSAFAVAAITSIETLSRGRQTARGFFTITNYKDRVMATFVSGGIPVGRNIIPWLYDILQKTPRGFYRLEPIDNNYGDDRLEGTRQSLVRLHWYGSGNTTGCISIINDKDWKAIDKLILSSITSIVTTLNILHITLPGGRVLGRIRREGTEEQVRYGLLHVIENLGHNILINATNAEISELDTTSKYIW
jgi:hypothetical protein